MRRALVLLALAGCSKLLGINDVTLVDGGGSDSAPPNTVVGKVFTRCMAPAGTVDTPVDMSTKIIQALIPDAGEATHFKSVDGTGHADGTFTISPVPDGMEYILKLDHDYYVTSQHSLDLHTLQGGRCNAQFATATSTLNFNLTGMQAYQIEQFGPSQPDIMEVLSLNAGYTGQTILTDEAKTMNMAYDWSANGGGVYTLSPPLPDATAGDDLTVNHVRSEIVDGFSKRPHQVTHTVDTFQTTMVTLPNGGTVGVNGTFTQVTNPTSVAFSLARGNFDSGYDGTSQFAGLGMGIVANPAPVDFQVGATVATIDFSDWSRVTTLSESLNVSFGDPFPTSWTRVLSVNYSRFRWNLFPGTTTPRPSFGGMFRSAVYTGGSPTLAPTMLPPSNVKVAGTDLGTGGKVTFDGMAPVTITWTNVPSAKVYRIVVRRMFANGSQSLSAIAAILVTPNASIDIPAEVFSGGEFFNFVVDAMQSPANYDAGELLLAGLPNEISGRPSGTFRLSATCGNGVLDGTEQCDAMGESATCTIYCTTSKCGDGIRNATAGEVCDTVRDTDSCDSDCTLPVCGDGHLNFVTEDCDDGNTIDDLNGCGANCKFNNVCGNGRVENLVEQCDPGAIGVDTATCDSDCTLPQCGDGHLNLAAGEKCDDGNNTNGDGCSSTCQIE